MLAHLFHQRSAMFCSSTPCHVLSHPECFIHWHAGGDAKPVGERADDVSLASSSQLKIQEQEAKLREQAAKIEALEKKLKKQQLEAQGSASGDS